MKNNRLHVITKYFYPVAAGIETNIIETYTVLAEKGWDITIHTSRDILTKKNCLPHEETIRGLKVIRYPFRWYGYIPRIRLSDADIICLHNFNIVPHLYFMLASLMLKIIGRKHFALVLTPHGGFNPEWTIFSWPVAFVKKHYHFTLGAMLTSLSVDGVRAVSEWEKTEMAKGHIKPSKIEVISNGIEDEAYWDTEARASDEIKDKIKSYGRYIIQIGRVYCIKNYETTIRAMPYLPLDVKYVIAGPVGDEKYKNQLDDLIRDLGLDGRVIFLGVIRGVDKYYLIKKAQMMVHMALWESFCNVVHEGLSQGLVCIVANNTALPHLVKNGVNGYCLATKDSNALAEKINFVLANKKSAFIREMEAANKIYGLQNSWREVASRMDVWYRNIVGGIRGARAVTPISIVWYRALDFFYGQRLFIKHPMQGAIGDWKLVRTFDKTNTTNNQYQFGIYENSKGDKAFAKKWSGRRKNIEYFWLYNECRAYEMLKSLQDLYQKELEARYPHIQIPRLLHIEYEKESLLLMTEFVPGHTLESLQMSKRVEIIEAAISYLDFLNDKFEEANIKYTVKRSMWYVLAMFCIMFVRAIARFPRIFTRLIESFVVFISLVPSLLRQNSIRFVHRDLTYLNILTDGNMIYIIDFELSVFTNPMFEITQIMTGSWRREGFPKEFYKTDTMKKIIADSSTFNLYKELTLYTAMHRLATCKRIEFDTHFSYLNHALKLTQNMPIL